MPLFVVLLCVCGHANNLLLIIPSQGCLPAEIEI